GRPAREQDRLGRQDHAPAERDRRRVSGRAVAAQESGAGDVAARGPAARRRGLEARERDGRAAQEPRRHGRPFRAHPHLQLPAGTGHGSSDQPDVAQARPHPRGRARRADRAARERVPCRSARRARRRLTSRAVSDTFCSVELGSARRFGDAVAAAAAALAGTSDSPRLDAELLLAHALPAPRSAVIAFPERPVGAEAARRFAALVARRAAGEPLAYLVGRKEFRSLVLEVGPAVLVPRPETEHLVDAALERLDGTASPAVLDLGTGSGAIALAVKSERPDAEVVAVDASRDALAVARANGARLGL